MKLLLDTQIFLWYISNNPKLSASAAAAIRDESNQTFVSVVSLWEIIIKHKLGKLPLARSPEVFFPEQRQLHRIDSLLLDEGGVAELAHLPALHRDPFDRMLISQAISRGLIMVTADSLILQYPVP